MTVSSSARPGPAPSVESHQALLEGTPLGLTILHEGRGGLAHDPGQDRPLDVPELLLDLLQPLLEVAPGFALRDPERIEMLVHGRDQVAYGLGTQELRPNRLQESAVAPFPSAQGPMRLSLCPLDRDDVTGMSHVVDALVQHR